MAEPGGLALADAAATEAAGRAFATLLRAGDVVTLSGGLGAGKTTFARGLLAALGLAEEAPSPSYALVIPYAPPETRLPVAHVDLYRLDEGADLRELGLDDYRADGVLLVEWPERLPGAWPDALALALVPAVAGRRLTWAAPAAWAGRWPPLR